MLRILATPTYHFRWELTFRTVFWAMFGLSNSHAVELGQGFPSRVTETIGYQIFGVYNWAAVIILLNMLIAMMTRSFEKITVRITDGKHARFDID